MKKVAVIGCGISALSFAYYARNGCIVDIYERLDSPGGLSRTFDFEGTKLELFYHHFFKSDVHLLQLLKELKLHDKIICKPSRAGIYYEKVVYPFSTVRDLLCFKPISFTSKIIFGMQMLYLKITKNWKHMESHSVKRWMERSGGKEIFEKIWGPLLTAKFGRHASEISMSWLWGRIHPRSRSREKGNESLCYLKGSFAVLFDGLINAIKANRGNLLFKSEVKELNIKGDKVILSTQAGTREYDLAVVTADAHEAVKMVSGISRAIEQKLRNIEYFGVVCLILKLSKPLGQMYWLNNTDNSLSFSGIIEHTNLVPHQEYGGHSVAYVFRYISPDEELFSMDKDAVYNIFSNDITKIYPDFKKDSVIEYNLSRDSKATPIYKGRYSSLKPSWEIIPDKIYMLNTSQLYPEDRNLNNGIALAKKLSCAINGKA